MTPEPARGRPDTLADVLVRAWEPNLRDEGARFKALTTIRRDVTFQARTGNELFAEQITRPGLVIVTESAAPASQNAADVCVNAIPSQIKFTILATDELVWFPLNAHRDVLGNWHIECIPFVEWLRIVLRNEPTLKGTPDGR